ncbi:MAG: hypothetical protein LH480_11840 [Rubrivivax sp.]|nr:hypothetical protein [Rubrivivax sp.]
MFASHPHRQDFADTRSLAPDMSATPRIFAGLARSDSLDIGEQLAQAEAADRQLLRLVVCAACVTLSLALAGSLI